MASGIYLNATRQIAIGAIDFDTSTFKVCLLTSTYALDATKLDQHDFYADLTNEVANGNGYTTGGNTVVPTVPGTVDEGNNRIDVTLPGTTWPASTITARYAVYYVSTGNSATSPLVCIVDFGSDVSSSSGTFTLNSSTFRFATA